MPSVDLVAPPSEMLLLPFIESYIAKRENELKPNTLQNMKWALEHAREFFGEGRALREVTVGDAEDFRRHLLGKGLVKSTAQKNCGILKHFFAMRREARNHRAKPVPQYPVQRKGKREEQGDHHPRDDRQSA